MAGLLYKELIQNRKVISLLLLGAVFFISMLIVMSNFSDNSYMTEGVMSFIIPLFLGCVFLFGGMAQSSIFAPDEVKVRLYFIQSTPLTVRGYVRSKYVFTVLISLFTLVICIVGATLVTAVLHLSVNVTGVLVAFFFVQILMRAIEYPTLFAFGSRFGNYYRIGVAGVLTLLAILYGLFGDLTIFGDGTRILDFIFNLINAENIPTVLVAILALAPVAVTGLFILSYKISCSVCLNGGEHFDK